LFPLLERIITLWHLLSNAIIRLAFIAFEIITKLFIWRQVVLALEDYNFGENRYQIAVVAIELAMDHKPSNREMTSLLLSDFYGQHILTEREIEKGTKSFYF